MRRGSQRFEAREQIATGATAVLWRGWDLEINRPVAIKRPHPHLVDDEQTRARFLREARNAAQISHPNVVQIYDVGIDDEGPWIAMELADGESLAAHLRRHGPLDPAQAARIGAQIASALAHAHRIPVVHRDVKPTNVIIDAVGEVRLVDFGLARLADDGTLTGTGLIAGTPSYMAPEILRGDAATPAGDVYALGIVMYELLTGSPPFSGDSALAVALAHDREEATPVDADRPLPAALTRLVTLSMSKDPARRPTAEALDAGLSEMARGGDATRTQMLPASDETVVLPLAAGQERRRADQGKRRRAMQIGAAALIAALILLAVGLASQGDDSPDRVSSATSTSGTRTATTTGTQATAPATTAATPTTATQPAGRSPAAQRVSELIAAARTAGLIDEETTAALEQRLIDAERAILAGDGEQAAQALTQLTQQAFSGPIAESSFAGDLTDAITTLATSWGLEAASGTGGGNGKGKSNGKGKGNGDRDD